VARDLKDGKDEECPVPYGSSLASVQLCSRVCINPTRLAATTVQWFNPLWARNAILSDDTFNSCSAGFSVGDVLTVIRWRVKIVDLGPHKTITNSNRFAADFFRVQHLAHTSTYKLRSSVTCILSERKFPGCVSNHSFLQVDFCYRKRIESGTAWGTANSSP
jgi:hypothetical protein